MTGKFLRIFYKSTVVHNSLPVNLAARDRHLFSDDEKIDLPQSGLFLLKNVFVTDLGIIYKNLSLIKENIVCYDIDFKNYRFKYFLKSFLKSSKLIYKGNKCIIVFDNYSGPNGFAHWLCDGLTRLAEMNDTLAEYTVIVPAYFKDQEIYSESLSLFNISRIHYLPENSITFFRELHFPTPIGDTGNFHPDNLKKLKDIVNSKIQLPAVTRGNIYISRRKAKRRFVQNEDEVTHLLARYNFEPVYLEEHSFKEQVKIMNGAVNIISIHGAALAMLLFANENASVMELRSNKDKINNMYYLLANICKLNYYYLACESIEKTKTANNFDLIVNLRDLEQNVKQMVFEKIDR